MKKLLLVLLMSGMILTQFCQTAQYTREASNQAMKLDYDDDDLSEFVNF